MRLHLRRPPLTRLCLMRLWTKGESEEAVPNKAVQRGPAEAAPKKAVLEYFLQRVKTPCPRIPPKETVEGCTWGQ